MSWNVKATAMYPGKSFVRVQNKGTPEYKHITIQLRTRSTTCRLSTRMYGYVFLSIAQNGVAFELVTRTNILAVRSEQQGG